MSDAEEMPPALNSGSAAGGAAPAGSDVHDTSGPPARQPYADELVKPQAKAPAGLPAPTLTIDKTQGMVFVVAYTDGLYTEFVLEDVVALVQENADLTVFLREGHCLSFKVTKINADTMLEAWRSRRSARRNA